MLEFKLQAIGIVYQSCFKEKFGVPRQAGLVPSSKAIIRLEKNSFTLAAIEGVNENSHLWVNFIFHLVPENEIVSQVRPPRLRGEKLGVWATRSPHRPNRLGLSVVKLEKLEVKAKSIELHISNHDLVEGTPILDIRPYVHYADSVRKTKGRWQSEMKSWPKLKVKFNNEVSLLLRGNLFLKRLIREVLSLDPRPSIQKEKDKTFGIFLDDVNVRFKVISNEVLVQEIGPTIGQEKIKSF